ncbi:MAG: NifB/NifX family molybdenum-iron cluster-binding protein [Armatimonadetes bacterium]|nr:NifB/NifX family molybdenum-iron cluster-binding protein [Armatimonadota bacterium]
MRVAFAVDGEEISAHFGHCAEYALVDFADGQVERQARIPTPPHQPGVLPPFLRRRGAECVVAGGMGPRAVELFTQLGIGVIVGVQGSLAEAIEAFLKGKLAGGESTCAHVEQVLSSPSGGVGC